MLGTGPERCRSARPRVDTRGRGVCSRTKRNAQPVLQTPVARPAGRLPALQRTDPHEPCSRTSGGPSGICESDSTAAAGIRERRCLNGQVDRHRDDFRRLLWTALHSESHPEVRGSRTGWREGRPTRAAVTPFCRQAEAAQPAWAQVGERAGMARRCTLRSGVGTAPGRPLCPTSPSPVDTSSDQVRACPAGDPT